MKQEQIRAKLDECHLAEHGYNKEMGHNRNLIAQLRKRNKVLALKISKNTKYRNMLISKLDEKV